MSATLADLPDDVAAAIRPHVEGKNPSLLSAIGVQIAQKRDEAKNARQSSGIETLWRECEEAYLGIDEANRHEFADARWAKPMSMDGPVTTGRKERNVDYRSTVYLRLTSRYVDAGVAKLTEILLPAADKAFSFNEMPVPELIEASQDESQVVHSELGEPLTRPANPGEPAPPTAPAPAGGVSVPSPAVPPQMPPAAPMAAPAPLMASAAAPPPPVNDNSDLTEAVKALITQTQALTAATLAPKRLTVMARDKDGAVKDAVIAPEMTRQV